MKSILKYIPSVIIPTICTLVITILYGNYLTPTQYGDLNIFTTTISLLDVIFFSFISLSIIRFYIIYKESMEAELLSTYFISMIIVLLLISIIGYLILGKNIWYIIISCGGYGFFTFYSNLLRAGEKSFAFNIIRIIVPISTIIILLLNIFILDKLSLSNVILSVFGPYTIVTLILTILYVLKKKIVFKFNKKIFRETLSYGIPLIGVGLLNLLLAGSDKYMINYYLGSAEVGIYSFGYRIAELSMINITNIIIMGVYPSLINAFEKQSKEDAEILLSRMLNLNFIVIIPIIFNLLLFIGDIIKIMFKNYIGAEAVVIFISFGTFLYATSFYLNKAFELTKNTKKMLIILALSTISNLILNMILIPKLGVMGAVISTLISYVIYIIISKKISRKLFEIKFNYKNIFIIVLVNIITFIIVFILNIILPKYALINVIIGGSTYLLIYGIIIYGLFKKKILLI